MQPIRIPAQMTDSSQGKTGLFAMHLRLHRKFIKFMKLSQCNIYIIFINNKIQ